jgi:hypothetical protein
MAMSNLLVFILLFLVVVLGMRVSVSIKEHIQRKYPSLWLSLGFPTINPLALITAKQESENATAMFRYLSFMRSKERKNLKDTYLDRLVFLFFLLALLGIFFLGLFVLVLVKYSK